MCQCEPVITLSPKARSLIKCLQILFFVYFLVLLSQLIFLNFNGAMSSVITMLVLVMTFLMCHFLLAGFVIFLVFFNLFYSLIFIGLRIQNKIAGLHDKYFKNELYIALIIIESLSIVFFIILIYYAFQAYREFKALYFSGGGYSNIKINNNLI
jgi:hypothetical protein